MMQNLLSSLAHDIFVLRYGDLPLPRHMMFEQGSCYKNIAIWHLALCPGVFVHRNLSTKCSCVCILLCTTVIHNSAQNSSDSFLSLPPDSHYCSVLSIAGEDI